MQQILAKASTQEEEYDWIGAVNSYRGALESIDKDGGRGAILERVGYGLYRAAMQAENRDTLRERLYESIREYGKSVEFNSGLTSSTGKGRSLRSRAMITYIHYWLAIESTEKRGHLDESWRLAKEALKEFHEAGEPLEYVRTYDQLIDSATLRYNLDPDFESVRKMVEDALRQGELGINISSSLRKTTELGALYTHTGAIASTFGLLFPEQEETEKFETKMRNYWALANENSEQTALLALARPTGAWLLLSLDPAEQEDALSKVQPEADKTGDRLFMGMTLDCRAYTVLWKALAADDSDERLELAKRALQSAEEAEKHYSVISLASPRGGVIWVGSPYTDYYWTLASWETDLTTRRMLLNKALEAAPELLKRAKQSGSPTIMDVAHHYVSKTLESLAKTEKDPEKKKSLLEEAMTHRNENINHPPPFYRYFYWNQGVNQNHLAGIKSELADLATYPQSRERMLREAIQAKESGITLCMKNLQFSETKGPSVGQRARLGGYQHDLGDMLLRLYTITNERDVSLRAAQAFENAAISFEKANMVSRIAESHWKSAQAYDSIDEHMVAAEKFSVASNNYRNAATKIPQLKEFYGDHASYMEAWNEIEKAKHHHSRQEYAQAKSCYEKSADLHKAIKSRAYLATNFSAWARVENAEDLSRKEESQKAIESFEEAARLFREGEISLRGEMAKIESSDEIEMAKKLVGAADLRQQYCQARILLEHARLFAKRGDHYSSSENYDKASQTLENISKSVESDNTRKELQLISTLSRAWQMMARAEDEASPERYIDAAKLFEEAKELSSNEKARALALGNSRFCRALVAGTKFTDTGDPSLHALAIQNLGSASSYYLKGDLKTASEYSRATELLFDAYANINKAKKEEDPDKKTKFYVISEKVLQASAEGFLKAEQPAKRELVFKLLGKVREERELAASMLEVLHSAPIVSSTASFTAPAPTREAPVGLERFEYADIQASLVTRQKNLKVGEDLAIEIELVNAGKGPAQLIKIDDVIPEGFELKEKPERYKIEDSHLNMKGKRLDPLKTEELKLALRPKNKGQFTLRPRILYLDESGKYKTYEPEPLEVTVKELGITGWVKGR